MNISNSRPTRTAAHWRTGTAGLLLAGVILTAPASAQPGPSLAAYRCDENAGTQVLDSSGNANHGANSGVTYSSDTPFPAPDNYALEFNHERDAVTIPAGPSTNLNSYTALTIEAHIKPTTTSGIHYILWADDGPFQLLISNGVLSFGLMGSSGSAMRSTAFTTTGAWTHVAGTWNGASSVLYVNGSPVASGAAAIGTVTVSPVRNIIRIGNDETADFNGFNRDFRGLIDEVRIVDRALSADEVLYDAMHSFNEAAGATLLRCASISSGAAASIGSGFIVNAGQPVIGRSAGTALDAHAGIIPCLPGGLPLPGDCDFDGALDYADVELFTGCMNGPDAGALPSGCDCADLDADGDSDLADFAGYQILWRNSG